MNGLGLPVISCSWRRGEATKRITASFSASEVHMLHKGYARGSVQRKYPTRTTKLDLPKFVARDHTVTNA